jgi:hypothetical protein
MSGTSLEVCGCYSWLENGHAEFQSFLLLKFEIYVFYNYLTNLLT